MSLCAEISNRKISTVMTEIVEKLHIQGIGTHVLILYPTGPFSSPHKNCKEYVQGTN
jgi:hypothetical protein